MSDSKEVSNEPESPRGKRPFRVVLTGGPCAGKTSSLSMISDHFRNLGWNVYCVPEAATLLVGGGVSWAQLNEDQGFHFQKNVIRTMIQIEDTYTEIASQSKDDRPSMILSDRGVMDCSAYVDSETFTRILAEIGIKSTFEVKENRYDMVIHLFSAAIGAEAHYDLSNNSARTESADQARIVDKNILKAWTGHPSIVCIDNRTIFKEKVLRSVQAICKKLGVPSIGDSTVKRKLKISAINPVPEHENIHYCESECEYTYLMDGETMQQRLRKRGNNGSFIYTHIIRAKLGNGKYSESSRNITRREYDSFLLMALPTNHRVLTLKRSFVFQNQYFNLLIYESVCPGLMLLEIYEDPDVELKLPTDLFTIEKEVTHDSEYSMFNLSKK